MGGLALLPWEKWAARVLHTLGIAIRRSLYRLQRRRSLARSTGWPEAEGTVESVKWDSSVPREEIAYTYETNGGVHSGYHWLWFESPNDRQPRAGDKIVIRYVPDDASESVFLRLV